MIILCIHLMNSLKIILRHLFFVYLLTAVYLFSNKVSAQHLIEANNSNPTDPKAMFINPALSSSLNPHVLLGIKFFNVGFLNSNSLGLRNNYLGFSVSKLPYINTGLGISIYHLGTPIFTKTSFGFNISKGFLNKIFLGSKLDIINSGFNESQFDLVHQDDPVFKNGLSKTVLSIGGGLLVRPFKPITIGYSVNHINTPNISPTQGNVTEPMLIDFGMSYMFPYFRLSSGMTWVKSEYYPNFSLDIHYWDFGTFCFGYGYSGLQLESRFNILKSVELNYIFNYPFSKIGAESFGSHQINLVFHLRKLEEPVNIFDIFIETDSLFVFEKWFHQRTEENIPVEITGEISSKEIPQYTKIILSDEKNSGFESKYYEKLYLSFLDSLSHLLKKENPPVIRIVSSQKELNRAIGMKEFLSSKIEKHRDKIIIVAKPAIEEKSYVSDLILYKEGDISGKNYQIFLSKNKTLIRIKSTYRMRTTFWKLEITNSSGEVIRLFEGKGGVSSDIEWDWCDTEGLLVNPGWYSAVFYWKDKGGRIHQSSKKFIKVIKRTQHIDVHITQQVKYFQEDTKVIDIILEE